MRIIIFLSSFDAGGAEIHSLKLADYFQNQKGYTVEVWVLREGDGDGYVREICNQKKIKTKVVGMIHKIHPYKFWRQIWYFTRKFRQFEPDVVISFNVIPNLVNGLIRPFNGAKCAVWSQQSEINYKFENWIDRWASGRIDCFISNSYHGLEKLRQRIKVPANRGFVIPNGIDDQIPKKPKEEWLKEIGTTDKDFKAVMTANITATKDHATLLKAWKIVVDELRQDGRKAILVLPGRHGETIGPVLELINALELNHFVKLPGPVNDIPGLNLAMDLGILSSPAEGMPNGLMENMKAGLPVVGTAIDGIKEVVGEQNFEYLSPVGDATLMAQNILRFARNPQLCCKVGAQNKLRIDTEFSLEKMCADTENVIRRFL